MNCCTRTQALAVDDRFGDDDFTHAALDERRSQAAHGHAAAILVTIAGFVFIGLLSCAFGRRS